MLSPIYRTCTYYVPYGIKLRQKCYYRTLFSPVLNCIYVRLRFTTLTYIKAVNVGFDIESLLDGFCKLKPVHILPLSWRTFNSGRAKRANFIFGLPAQPNPTSWQCTYGLRWFSNWYRLLLNRLCCPSPPFWRLY